MALVVVADGGGKLASVTSFVSQSWKEVGDIRLPNLERNSHPPLYNGLARLARPLRRSAGKDGQRTEERVDRDLQGYPHKVGERSRGPVATAEPQMTIVHNSHIGRSRELDTGQLSDNIKKHRQ